MQGLDLETSPYVSLTEAPTAAAHSDDIGMRTIATGRPGHPLYERAPDIGEFDVSVGRLHFPEATNLLSLSELEVLFLGEDLEDFLVRWHPNRF